jgi:hypothetical protein
MDELWPELILPGQFADPSGIVRLTPEVLHLRPREQAALRAFAPDASVVALTRPPSFFDQIHVYATHQELYPFLLDPEVMELVKLQPTTTADVIDRIREIPFEPAMRFVASLQKFLSFGRVDLEWQRRMMYEIYGDSPVAAAGERFLRSNGRAAIFSEQQFFALQRLLVLYAAETAADDLTPAQHTSLRMALFYLPGTVLQDEVDLEPSPAENVDDERWLRYFVGSGGFAAHGWLKHDMARAHQLYETIAKSRRARRHRDYCALETWLVEAYNFTFVELQALGFALLAGSQLQMPDRPPLIVTPGYFDTTALAGRLQSGFHALAADREWFREQFARTAEHPRRAAFEIQPFLRRPGLRQADGNIAVLAPRAIEGWLSANGTYYRLLDLARERGDDTRKRFGRFNGFLHESYARKLVQIAHPNQQRRTFAVGRVHGELPYLVKKNQRKTSDVVIDLGLDLVLIEVTAKRLTEKSTVDADADAVRSDLQKMIVKKMGQLGRVIRDVFGDPSCVPDLDLRFVQRVWPVIVCADGIFHNPSIWAYTQNEGGRHLDIPRSEVNAEIKPLVLLDLEELEVLMGVITQNHSLIDILERKTSEAWKERDMKALLSEEWAHRWTGEVKFVSEEQRRAMKAIVTALDLPGRRSREHDETRVRQAA